MQKLEVCLSPALLHLYDLSDASVVIIDIFRATTTMVTALGNGAKAIIPVDSVEQCIAIGKTTPNCITAGERDGFIAPGLAYGNSPTLVKKEFIADKTLVMTTTNGTRLLHQAREAQEIIIGAFANLSAIEDYLIQQKKHVILACASWKDRVNMEDSLFAGAVTSHLQKHFSIDCDSAQICMTMWNAQNNILDYLKTSNHYKRLSSRGLEEDLEYCTKVDIHPCVPLYNKVQNTIFNVMK